MELPLFFLALAFGTASAQAQIKLTSGMLGAGVTAAKAAPLSDQEVLDYTKEYAAWSDANTPRFHF